MSNDLKFQSLLQQLENLAEEFNNQPSGKSKKLAAIIYFVIGCVGIDKHFNKLVTFVSIESDKNLTDLIKPRR